ncbi:MAG: lipoyl(octanoyl) transferase LipB [Proteobacteria bacterium]|nr:lipoyl(octanoyl) transferase LipB [Pseudomonadota bacterium]
MEWIRESGALDYDKAVRAMEAHVAAIRDDGAEGRVWLVEHPPLYTAGTSAQAADLLDAGKFPVYETGRGGEYTYHGPGQRVAYVMLDLKARGGTGSGNRSGAGSGDVRGYVRDLEQWIIETLAAFGVTGERRQGRVGIWVVRAGCQGGIPREDKIAAIGVRVRKWVTYHGISLNVAPDLSHYDGIVPCGIAGHGVTSLKDLGIDASMEDVDAALKTAWDKVFGA